jgi:hypothetical protein
MNGGMNANAERMSLRRKIGQLLMCGFEGTEPSASIVRLIREYGLGGVVYFRRNLRNAEQAAALSASLQAVSDIPLLVAVDQEGGMVVRLEDGVTAMPGAMAIGAADDEGLAFEAARQAGAEPRVGTEVVEAIRQTWTLADALREEGYSVAEVRVGTHPSGQESSAAMTAASVADAVVFASYDAAFSGGQTRLIADLNRRAADGGQTFVLVATRSPYDLRNVPDVPVYVCAYENKPAMVAAAAGVLSGRLHGRGRLPVPIGI